MVAIDLRDRSPILYEDWIMSLDFFEILVIILLIAKITGHADISWWIVAAPYLIGIVVHTLGGWVAERKMKRVVRRF